MSEQLTERVLCNFPGNILEDVLPQHELRKCLEDERGHDTKRTERYDRTVEIAVTSTKTERAPVDGNFSIDIARRIARQIAPGEPFPAVPGGGES